MTGFQTHLAWSVVDISPIRHTKYLVVVRRLNMKEDDEEGEEDGQEKEKTRYD
jgi:hypothetical protein